MEFKCRGNSKSLQCIWQNIGSIFRKLEDTNLTTKA